MVAQMVVLGKEAQKVALGKEDRTVALDKEGQTLVYNLEERIFLVLVKKWHVLTSLQSKPIYNIWKSAF